MGPTVATVRCSGCAGPVPDADPADATASPNAHITTITTPVIDLPTTPTFPRAVAHDLAGRAQTGKAGDAAAAVRRAARLVQTVDRCAEIRVSGCGTHVKKL